MVINLSTIFQLVANLATSQQLRLHQKTRQLGETFQLRPNLGGSRYRKVGRTWPNFLPVSFFVIIPDKLSGISSLLRANNIREMCPNLGRIFRAVVP